MNKINRFEIFIYLFITLLVLSGIILAYVDHDFFKTVYVVEDGPIEWLTVIALASGFIICSYRIITLFPHKQWLYLLMTFLLACIFLFVAGEEISWGQRIFHVQSSHWFQQNNAQQETNFHNMRIGGKKINKPIFTYGLGAILLFYWFILTPLYHRKQRIAQLLDKLAAPIPKTHHIIAYVFLTITIQALVLSSKKGELLEACGVLIFIINILYPHNQSNLQKPRST